MNRISGVFQKIVFRFRCGVVIAGLLVVSTNIYSTVAYAKDLNARTFQYLLETLAAGWNSNDAKLAVSVFADDAVYVEPPDKQLYVGRDEIYEFFGGDEGRDSWMKMQWHNIAFNELEQTGSGEFTFSWEGGQVHGMVSVKVRDGKIALWREYFYASDLNWKEFSKVPQIDE